MRLWTTFACVIACGCLDPLVSDEVPPRDILSPDDVLRLPEAEVPWASGDMAEQIEEHDGVEGGLIPRLSGFVKRQRIWYWDMGPAPKTTAPLWILVGGANDLPIPHPPIWDVIPGDPGYSPFWEVFYVDVTERYAGEQIVSRQGLEDAIRIGLVEEPEAVLAEVSGEYRGVYVNCPVVAEHTKVAVGGLDADGVPIPPFPSEEEDEHWAYYRGVRVEYIDFDMNASSEEDEEAKDATPSIEADFGAPRATTGREIPVGAVYELQRISETLPISEPERGVDMTGDGDTVDTNNVFSLYLEDRALYTPLWRSVDVIVAAGYQSIETLGEMAADIMDEELLFTFDEDGNRVPEPAVLGWEEEDEWMNCPIQTRAGQI